MTSDIMTAVKFLAAEAPQRHHIYGVPFFGTCEEVRRILDDVGVHAHRYEMKAAMVEMVRGQVSAEEISSLARDYSKTLAALRDCIMDSIDALAEESSHPEPPPAAAP